jgi:hypothetical protein
VFRRREIARLDSLLHAGARIGMRARAFDIFALDLKISCVQLVVIVRLANMRVCYLHWKYATCLFFSQRVLVKTALGNSFPALRPNSLYSLICHLPLVLSSHSLSRAQIPAHPVFLTNRSLTLFACGRVASSLIDADAALETDPVRKKLLSSLYCWAENSDSMSLLSL